MNCLLHAALPEQCDSINKKYNVTTKLGGLGGSQKGYITIRYIRLIFFTSTTYKNSVKYNNQIYLLRKS